MVSVVSPYLLTPKNMEKSNKTLKDKVNELDVEFSEYGKNALDWRRQCELMLPKIVKFDVWKYKGCSSVYEYAAKKAGMSKYTVNEALRVMKKIEDMPELIDVAVEKGVGRVKPVATIATKEDAGFWAKKASGMSKHVLETYVKNVRETGLPGKPSKPDEVLDGCGKSDEVVIGAGKGSGKAKVVMELDIELVDKLKKLRGDGDWNNLIKKFIDESEVCNSSVGEKKPGIVKGKSRHVPVKIRRYVGKKNSGMCGFSGCCKKGKELHHVRRWRFGQVHDPDKMALLCEEHHKLVHLGLADEDGKVRMMASGQYG
jgi:hypothetical protein